MKVLITGSKGFIGKNLIEALNKKFKNITVYEADIDTPNSTLFFYTKDCDFVYNFAAVHRPKNSSEFNSVNYCYLQELINMLIKNKNYCPILYTSSIQAGNGSEYGNSKIYGENACVEYSKKYKTKTYVWRLTNVYGRYARPNSHSVVATFCYNIQHSLPITISDPSHVMNFYYIDDVVDAFISCLEDNYKPDKDGFYRLDSSKIYSISLGKLADLLKYFKREIDAGHMPSFKTPNEQRMYATFLSYK